MSKVTFKKTGLFTDVNLHGFDILLNGEKVGQLTPMVTGYVVQLKGQSAVYDLTLPQAKKQAKASLAS